MMVGDRVLGVIATYHPERDYVYSGDDLDILQAMASQAAVALDNVSVFDRLETRVKFMEGINSGTHVRQQQILSEARILELIYNEISELMDADNMSIALYDEATDKVHFKLVVREGQRMPAWDTRPGLSGTGKTNEIIRTRSPILLSTEAEEENWYAKENRERYLAEPRASYLGVPMVVRKRVLGVIDLYHLENEYEYDGNDLELLQSVADQAAIALDNARLYAKTRQLQEEIIAKEQIATLGTAIAALQHRINNTFNIIVPNVTRLRKRVDMTDEEIVEILDIIERNARYTSDIIARIQEPLREVEMQDVDINAVLGEVIDMMEKQWGPDIVVVQDLDDDIPLIQAPIGQVTEVFSNLSDNACRAMDGNGRLAIASCLNSGIINVRVQDTGPGIPPRIQARLFEKPVPSKSPGGGAGLGLWLSQLMLQTLGGGVEIEKTDSTGTTMLVNIPA